MCESMLLSNDRRMSTIHKSRSMLFVYIFMLTSVFSFCSSTRTIYHVYGFNDMHWNVLHRVKCCNFMQNWIKAYFAHHFSLNNLPNVIRNCVQINVKLKSKQYKLTVVRMTTVRSLICWLCLFPHIGSAIYPKHWLRDACRIVRIPLIFIHLIEFNN